MNAAARKKSDESQTNDPMQAEVDRLKKEIEGLKRQHNKLDLRVSQKGAVSLYGFFRFPVTLYKQQWLMVLDRGDEIRDFITQNDSKLATKPDRTATEVQKLK